MKQLTRSQFLGSLLTVVVAGAVAIGIYLAGSPADERGRRLDERRVEDLTGIARAIDLYWTRHASLPSSLDELAKEPGADIKASDPGTNDPYEYRPMEGNAYELCAQFQHDSRPKRGATGDGFWSHGAGRQCFRREARKLP